MKSDSDCRLLLLFNDATHHFTDKQFNCCNHFYTKE